jgi:RimJ/RimL family protein N-acetyltransferase
VPQGKEIGMQIIPQAQPFGEPFGETERLILRHWRATDRKPFAAVSADADVMRYFPATLDETASNALVDLLEARWAKNGFAFPAVERKVDQEFLGFIGLSCVPCETAFAPAVEIGWRLARHAWGQGYAIEGARQALHWGFSVLNLDDVVSFTAEQNTPSRRVMERIGMTRDEVGDFDHPLLDETSPLQRHVLCRIKRPAD